VRSVGHGVYLCCLSSSRSKAKTIWRGGGGSVNGQEENAREEKREAKGDKLLKQDRERVEGGLADKVPAAGLGRQTGWMITQSMGTRAGQTTHFFFLLRPCNCSLDRSPRAESFGQSAMLTQTNGDPGNELWASLSSCA
jgi:hypothetical protein